jgi:hypothetical protein
MNDEINLLSHQKIFGQKIKRIDVDVKFKGIIIGDKGVGKTSIFRKLNSYELKNPGFKNYSEYANFYVVIENNVV